MTTVPVHVTKRALAHLLGKLDAVLEATLPFGELACNGANPLRTYIDGSRADKSTLLWEEANSTNWVSLSRVKEFMAGKPIDLPTCPRCAIFWDDAMETYARLHSTGKF